MPSTPLQHHLSVSGSGAKSGPPPPIDNAACVALIAGALKGAREKTRELLSRNGAAHGDNGIQKPGVTLDLSHQRIANIPIEVIELIKDEIERSVVDHHRCIPVPPPPKAVLTRSGVCCCLHCATPELPNLSHPMFFPRTMHLTILRASGCSQACPRAQPIVLVPKRICQFAEASLPESAV
jgi:hypothetical protein